MSKLDAQRAMREAKFARDQARAQGISPTKRAVPVAPDAAKGPSAKSASKRSAGSGASSTVPSDSGPPTAQSADQAEEPCGHRSMNGRTCTRESGHASKAHRYAAPMK